MPESDPEVAALLLQRVGHWLRKLSSDDVADLVTGRAVIQLHYPDRAVRRTTKLSNQDQLDILQGLTEMSSRADGETYLQSLRLNRTSLEALARHLEVPVQKSDNVARLREKLIESAIGYRLRSQAIRGERPASGDTESRTTRSPSS